MVQRDSQRVLSWAEHTDNSSPRMLEQKREMKITQHCPALGKCYMDHPKPETLAKGQ